MDVVVYLTVLTFLLVFIKIIIRGIKLDVLEESPIIFLTCCAFSLAILYSVSLGYYGIFNKLILGLTTDNIRIGIVVGGAGLCLIAVVQTIKYILGEKLKDLENDGN